MRAGALDFGKVRVGAAVSDDRERLAHPRPYFSGANLAVLLREIALWAKEEGLELVIVGLPLQSDGSEGLAVRRVRRFAELVARKTGLPVELRDERLTTVEARRRLRAQGCREKEIRDRVDSAAAAVLLQSWLDGRALRAGRQRDEEEDDA